MSLHLYNTLTRRKEEFVPIFDRKVRMYVCGPTVYDFAHIGNARPIIVFDLLFRLLRHIYGASHVVYARNITDVDDKINARAKEEGVSIAQITARTTAQFHQDVAALGALKPTVEPRATDHIRQMIEMIETLIDKGCAYEAEGHVLFHVPAMKDYGALSGRSVDDMIAGARVDVAPFKKDPMDFVLWKPSDDTQPGWNSPWGRGRPGWHIECSAMARRHLGETFDIHGGGIDLVFPHHENEIAQSRCAHGTEVMANYWMHNGHLQVEGEKMSKSLGNFLTINDLLKEFPGEALRLNMLSTQYRQPMNWTSAGVKNAFATLDNWYKLTADVGETEESEIAPAVLEALEDDLNTPRAITEMHNLRQRGSAGDDKARRALKASAQLMGMLVRTADEWAGWRPAALSIDAAEIDALVIARAEARAAKDFAKADRLREEIEAKGVRINDGPGGTTWEVAR